MKRDKQAFNTKETGVSSFLLKALMMNGSFIPWQEI